MKKPLACVIAMRMAVDGELISRSQAARVTAQFGSFTTVELDFLAIPTIGQGFADELFRVWPLAHPDTTISVTNASDAVKRMVAHVVGRDDLPQVEGRRSNNRCCGRRRLRLRR